MISVIVPVYNVKPYLEESIQSVIHQTFRDLEIILVDDGSTDGSGEICDRYAEIDSRIRVIHQENRGLSAARNAGLDICHGDIIAFLDSDDAFLENALEVMEKAMRASGADIVECNFSSFPRKKRSNLRNTPMQKAIPNHKPGLYSGPEAMKLNLYRTISNSVWNKIYRREIWNRFRFRSGQNFEDTDIILPVLHSARNVYLLDDVLILYRRRPESITQTLNLKNLMDITAAYTHYTNYICQFSPQYFTDSDLDFVRRKQLFSMLSFYYRGILYPIPQKERYLSYLNKCILDLSASIDLSKCSLRLKAAAWFYHTSPMAVNRMLYRFYRFYRSSQTLLLR
ncbi:glycosyltransferase family 2 protein [[Clostridium] aminophilum]|uniref:glycosyltransferase family 2 protein n=1 Tax=[Clostridium] aminophilum TaxID=1526 RepID=UPI00331E3DDD